MSQECLAPWLPPTEKKRKRLSKVWWCSERGDEKALDVISEMKWVTERLSTFGFLTFSGAIFLFFLAIHFLLLGYLRGFILFISLCGALWEIRQRQSMLKIGLQFIHGLNGSTKTESQSKTIQKNSVIAKSLMVTYNFSIFLNTVHVHL